MPLLLALLPLAFGEPLIAREPEPATTVSATQPTAWRELKVEGSPQHTTFTLGAANEVSPSPTGERKAVLKAFCAKGGIGLTLKVPHPVPPTARAPGGWMTFGLGLQGAPPGYSHGIVADDGSTIVLTRPEDVMVLTDKGVVLFRIPSAMGDLTYEFRGTGGGLAAITMLGECPL